MGTLVPERRCTTGFEKMDNCLIHSTQCCVGRKERKFEKREINQIPALGIIVAARMEWLSKSAFHPQKMKESFAFASTTARWEQRKTRNRTLYRTWTNVSTHMAMQRFFRHLKLNPYIAKLKLPRKMQINLFLSHHGLFRFITYHSGWNMRQTRFNKQCTSYWRKASGNLTLYIWTIWSFFEQQTNISIIVDKFSSYY